MKYLLLTTLVALVISCAPRQDVKVACIGDSITEGYAIEGQSDNSYPAALNRLLGDGYEVINFGRNSTAVMRDSDVPYWSVTEFANVIEYRPDIAIVKLGTNDSKRYQWNVEKFEASYQALIDTLNSLESKPLIKICLPVPVMATRWEITDSVVSLYVIPSIKKIAEKNNLEIIDLNTPLLGHNELYVNDGVHPNKQGAQKMAEIIAAAIKK